MQIGGISLNKKNILIVEDDVEINNLLKEILTQDYYNTKSAFSGTEALLNIQNQVFDMILLDLMLPGMDGESLLSEIREDNQIPIIIISAKNDVHLKSKLLRLGADDYITKPFNNEEVLARVETNLRRYNLSTKDIVKNLKFKDITVDIEAKSVYVNSNKLTLTSKEYSILELMISNKNKIFSKSNIFETVWKEDYSYDENTINVHMSNIRSKLKKVNEKEDYIETVWGLGYKLALD